MLRMRTLIASTLAGLSLLSAEADATIIRTAKPGDPYLFPSVYSYVNSVADNPGGYIPISKTDAASKPYPISNSLTGQFCGNNGGCTILTSRADSTTSDAHLGSVSASVQTDYAGAAATATLIYYFTLVGPAAASVPVTISGFGMADAHPGLGNFADSSASIHVDYSNGGRFLSQWDYTISEYEHNSFSQTIDVIPNLSSYQGTPRIVLQAIASAGDFGGGYWDPRLPDYYKGGASSSIDPLISIADPDLAKLYTIVVGLSSVPGSGTMSPVPLPASAPMFGFALLALGVAGYGMKRKMSSAAC